MKKTTRLIICLFLSAALMTVGFFGWRQSHPGALSPAAAPSQLASPPSLRIVAFGDSLTAGYNLPLTDAYPAQLERSLAGRGYAVEVINAGVSGETSAGGVRRTDFIRSLASDIVLFGLGGNDALRLLDPVELERNLAQALEALRQGEDPPVVLLLGMRAPGNADQAYRTAFDEVYPRLAERFGLLTIPFWLEGVALDPRYNLSDGIHPNREGYARIIERHILPNLLPIIERARPEVRSKPVN